MLKSRVDPKRRVAVVALGREVPRESALMAAHVLSRKAEVWLSAGKAELRPKARSGGRAALEALAAEFAEEVVTAELRRRVAAANRSVREYVVTQALLSALGEQGSAPAEKPMGRLTPEQEGDVERLIQEAEAELSSSGAPPGGDKPLEPSRILEAWEKGDGGKP